MLNMYNTPNQAIQQNSPYPRFQTVGPLDVSNNTMPVANRAVAAPLAPSQRQTTEWGMSFTGGDKKTLEMAEHVKMKVLPFYEIKKNVIKQRCLAPNRVQPAGPGKQMRLEAQLDFGLTFEDCNLIAGSKELLRTTNKIDYGYQLQLRFGVLNTTGEQDDEFPPSMVLKVNNRPVPLPAPIPSNYPGTPPRQPSKPLNVTSQAKLRPIGLPGLPNPSNTIVISWLQDIMNRSYVVSLNLVKKLTSEDLFTKLKEKGPMESLVTKKMIESVMKVDDDGLAPAALKVSVACPVGKSRMVHPCRATTCTHIQCFDATGYLQMNEKKPVWSCPVCNKKILYNDITIDGYFVEIIKELKGQSVTDIEINADGTWSPIEVEKESAPEEPKSKSKKPNKSGDVEMMSVDAEGNRKENAGAAKKESSASSTAKDSQLPQKMIETICISDDSEDESPPPAKIPPPKPVQKVNPIPVTSNSTTAKIPPQAHGTLAMPATSSAPTRAPPPPDDDDDVICLSD